MFSQANLSDKNLEIRDGYGRHKRCFAKEMLEKVIKTQTKNAQRLRGARKLNSFGWCYILNIRISNMDVEGTCTLKTADRAEKDFRALHNENLPMQ